MGSGSGSVCFGFDDENHENAEDFVVVDVVVEAADEVALLVEEEAVSGAEAKGSNGFEEISELLKVVPANNGPRPEVEELEGKLGAPIPIPVPILNVVEVELEGYRESP